MRADADLVHRIMYRFLVALVRLAVRSRRSKDLEIITCSCAMLTGLAGTRALVRDRGSQFIDAFDEIFRTERMKILKTPVRTPVANAFAERWIGTLRRELLDRTIIWNRRQLNNLVVDYIDHYNTHRPHRSLDQRPPVATDAADQPDRHLQVVRTARCGGLINEYRNAA